MDEAKNIPLVIYHHPCSDGTAAAWAVWKHFDGKVELVPTNYGLPMVAYTEGRDVYIVDFSFDRETLTAFCANAAWVTLIDHHKKAMDDLLNWDIALRPDNLTLVLDARKSGAVLTWKHLFPQADVPDLIAHVGDRDMWQWRIPGTREYCAFLDSFPFTVEAYDRVQIVFDTDYAKEVGTYLVAKQTKEVNAALSNGVRWHLIAGHAVPVVNVPGSQASDVGNALMESRACPFAATYYDSATDRKWSLRSNEQGMDVNEIAMKFKGGGHRNAAGFKTALGYMFPKVEEQHDLDSSCGE